MKGGYIIFNVGKLSVRFVDKRVHGDVGPGGDVGNWVNWEHCFRKVDCL